MKKITASEMGKLSFKARMKIHGKKGVSDIMRKAQKRSLEARKANKVTLIK